MDTTLKHQIGQMLIAGFPSQEVDCQARRLAEEWQVGNFILFARNMQTAGQTARLCAGLSALAFEKTGLSPFIAADQEGGLVCRITEGAALFPGAMALAAGAGPDRARQVGENCGRMLRAMGVNVNFAPVLDVNIEPLNPVIGIRSFGDDPRAVARMGCAVMEGLTAGGVLATVKHYPGHGNVRTDSHLDLPVNDTDPALLEDTEFLPFREAFRRGAPAVMSCHIRFPKLDPELPATLSPAIITGLLREKQGFRGLVCTDCMEMDAIQKNWGTAEGAVLAVLAGCDLLCISHHMEAVAQAAEALYRAVETGRIPRERIRQSYDRIVAAKKRLGLDIPQHISEERALSVVEDPGMLALHRQVSRDSVTLVWDRGGLAALRKAKAPVFLSPVTRASTGVEDREQDGLSFARIAAGSLGGTAVEISRDPGPRERADIVCRVAEADAVVLALQNARARPGQAALLQELQAPGRPLVAVLLGGPYDAALAAEADAVVAAYEYTALSAGSVADALKTGVFRGKLPVKL